MKIALLHTMYAPRTFGGAERAVQHLAEGLVAAGHEVVVIASAPLGQTGSRCLNGVRVHDVGLMNAYWPYGPAGAPRILEPAWHVLDLWNPWMVGRARRLLSREKPDVLHTHSVVGFSPAIWRMSERLGLPLVHTLHDHRLLCVRAVMFKKGSVCQARCAECRATSVLKRPHTDAIDVVVGVSRAILDRHLEAGFFRSSHTAVVPPVVKLVSGDPLRITSRGLRPIRFGYLGRLQLGKGLELLLEACSLLPREGWDVSIAGTGEQRYEDQLQRAPRPRSVRFVGAVEASQFFREIDVLVVPSQLVEGRGIAAMEAHAHGVPVIGADRGGIPEVVGRDGSAGTLFSPESAEDLAKAMRAFVDDPRRASEMRASCLDRTSAFGADQFILEHERCYEVAVNRRMTRRP